MSKYFFLLNVSLIFFLVERFGGYISSALRHLTYSEEDIVKYYRGEIDSNYDMYIIVIFLGLAILSIIKILIKKLKKKN